MAIDQYSLCPCGNGKKIKFCKCHDHLAEITKIDRMIEGEQFVAALDRINAILKSLPSEPWLLAMKCELLLRLHEPDLLEEASAKFIRLQPDNPVAKLYRCMVALRTGSVEEAASLLNQALVASAGHGLNPLYLSAAINVARALKATNHDLPGYMILEQLLDLEISDSSSNLKDYIADLYRQFTTDQATSILMRESPPYPAEAEGEAFEERFREAMALLEKQQVQPCKTKLDGIIREYGPHPSLLAAKVLCQLMVADQAGAAETCVKLARTESLDLPRRAYYMALAFDLAPSKAGAGHVSSLCSYEIDDEHEWDQKLAADARMNRVQEQSEREYISQMIGEEVPPKAVFFSTRTIETNIPDDLGPLSEYGDWIALFGKQTDKPARLVILEHEPRKAVQWRIDFLQSLGLDSARRQVLLTTTSPPGFFFNPMISLSKAAPEGSNQTIAEAIGQHRRQTLLELDLPMFNGGNLLSRANDPNYRVEVEALLLYSFSREQSPAPLDFDGIFSELNIEKGKIGDPDDLFDQFGGAAYFYFDPATADESTLIMMTQTALSRNVVAILPKLVRELSQRTWSSDNDLVGDYLRLTLEHRLCIEPEKKMTLAMELYEKGQVIGVNGASLAIHIFETFLMSGRQEEASAFLEKAMPRHQNDPGFLAYFQRLMNASRGAGTPSGMSGAGTAGASGSGGSGLWTPGQSTSPAATSSGSAGSTQQVAGGQSSGSGLWIPGE